MSSSELENLARIGKLKREPLSAIEFAGLFTPERRDLPTLPTLRSQRKAVSISHITLRMLSPWRL